MLNVMPLWLYVLILPAIIAWQITCWSLALTLRLAVRFTARWRKEHI